MKDGELDSIDRHILYYLQQDARHTSSSDIANKLDLSPSTVRTRLNALEKSDIIQGYHIDIDYEAAGFPLHVKIICSSSIPDRERLAKAALEIEGVTAVREVMTGRRNVYVNAIGTDHDDLNRIGTELDDLGLDVEDEQLIREEYVCQYRGFLTRKDETDAETSSPE